ncbi:hypothetical protein ACB092_04G205000 [Castanea dentata]
MVPIKTQNIRAIKKYKGNQLLDNLLLYSLTAITCSLFCSSPFWFPSLSSSMKVFLFVSLPKIGSVFSSYKFMFIVGNLIVGVLIGESKIFSSDPSSACDEYINISRSLQSPSTIEVKAEGTTTVKYVEENVLKRIGEDGEDIKEIGLAEENDDLDGNDDFAFPAEELSKRADDFIARVNKQRQLEDSLLLFSSE